MGPFYFSFIYLFLTIIQFLTYLQIYFFFILFTFQMKHSSKEIRLLEMLKKKKKKQQDAMPA